MDQLLSVQVTALQIHCTPHRGQLTYTVEEATSRRWVTRLIPAGQKSL